ncbi:MAG: lytic transglycosylase domain-containing protein [Candidatus Didemnitutus sp.]|nr:lytic transglycosylase domain-containing protein [Candidatus Didemnitutus sp.]
MFAPLRLVLLCPLLFATAWAQSKSKPAEPEPTLDLGALYQQGKALFDNYAPDEIKRDYRFPTREEFNSFAARLQAALEGSDLAALAEFAPEMRDALRALPFFPGYEHYTEWLTERLDYAEAAALAVRRPATPPPTTKKPAPSRPVAPTPSPTPPPTTAPRPTVAAPVIPHYDLWLARVKSRPVPPRAAALLPRVRPPFTAEGVSAALLWLAEAESSFNPAAVSPVGAKGLFQLMPATARELGLSTTLPDERGHPEKNAGAAARYLKQLHTRFGDWPLALAAYNAGPGRVQRLLTARKGKTFADIADHLPSETRMYVPKVLALLKVRAGVDPGQLPSPHR